MGKTIIWFILRAMGSGLLSLVTQKLLVTYTSLGIWLETPTNWINRDVAYYLLLLVIGIIILSSTYIIPYYFSKRKRIKSKYGLSSPLKIEVEKKADIINQLNQFVRNGNDLLLQIGKTHSNQFPSKYPLSKNMKESPFVEKIAEWSDKVFNYLNTDVQTWAEYYRKLSTHDITINPKPYTIPQEKHRALLIAILQSRINRILEIIKHVDSSGN